MQMMTFQKMKTLIFGIAKIADEAMRHCLAYSLADLLVLQCAQLFAI